MVLEVFGVIGAIVSQAAGIPQLLRLFKMRMARDVSLLAFIMLWVGNLIMLFYFSICVKCRTKREMKDARAITMKNGKPATQGACPVCGTKMFRIGKS